MLFYDLMAYSWLSIVQTLDMSCRAYLHQVLVAGVVLCQQDEVIIAPVIRVL